MIGSTIGFFARRRDAFAARMRDKRGVALIEFAFTLPILMGVGMYGAETGNMAIVNMRVSQAALMVADNASRVGEDTVLNQKRIYESDITEMLLGADLLAGDFMDLYGNGRVIVSSLEVNADGGQWIHWQRCKGEKVYDSSYGEQGDGATGTSFAGMGPSGEEIIAVDGEAVIFVEIAYDYQPLISDVFANVDTLYATAAFNVRDDRDLTQIYKRTATEHVESCDNYDSSF